MKILRLRARFGKLREELELHEGMNLRYLPNEAGKSTWSAFLLAMLYGIDTSERANAANQGLPMKERYKPWDGGAMEGAMELEWNGRNITIERTTTGRVPMGVFRAYETASGSPVAELTAENCGRMLCGVERSVFERTAFIRQLGLAVTGDARLEQRLGALVSTGEEGASYSELEKTLRGKKNQLIGRAGRLPKLQQRQTELTQTLHDLRGKQEELLRVTEQRKAAEQETARLKALLARIELAQAAKSRAALGDVSRQRQAQEQLCRRLEETAKDLPEEADLLTLRRELERAENDLQTARLELALGLSAPEKPNTPPVFAGLDAAEAKEQTQKDAEAYRRLTQTEAKKPLLPLLLWIAVALAGAGLCMVSLLVGAAVAAVGVLATIAVWWRGKRNDLAVQENQARAAELLARYDATKIDEIFALAEAYAEEQRAYEAALAAANQEREDLQTALASAEQAVSATIQRTAQFTPNCTTVAECRNALTTALHARERLTGEQRTLETLRRQEASLQEAFGDAPNAPTDAEALTFDQPKLAYEYRQASQTLGDLTYRQANLQGTISAKGDALAMEAELERIGEELAAVAEKNEAIDLALAALKSADETLRSRFSPQITAEAGGLLARMTDGKYPDVLLSPEMSLSVREENGTVMRPAAAMSCGTADQMYLALRLAMCNRLLPEGVPLVLDDALVNFDETRAAAALQLLSEEAEKRQVILFTCRKFWR